MTHDQMYDLIEYSIQGACTKAPLEALDGFGDVSRREVEEFFQSAAFAVKAQVDRGNIGG
jgi:hypothetical protein